MGGGAITALACLVSTNSQIIYQNLSYILQAAQQGSVITKDQTIKILTLLAGINSYENRVYPILFTQLEQAPENQFPMYAEEVANNISEKFKKDFINILEKRMLEIQKESKRKRIAKIIQKFLIK